MKDTALILGNGPSLDQLDPSLLDHFYTIGTNNIWVKFPEWKRETDAVVIVDANRLFEIGKRYMTYQGELYIGHLLYFNPPVERLRKLLGRDFIPIRQLKAPGAERWPWLTSGRIKSKINGSFLNVHELSFDLESGFRFGASVVVPAVQLAGALGFKRILLHGVDASYSLGASYFSGIQAKLHLPERRFEYNFRADFEPLLVKAQVYFEDMNVELIDCTPGGRLRFIAKGRLGDFCSS